MLKSMDEKITGKHRVGGLVLSSVADNLRFPYTYPYS